MSIIHYVTSLVSRELGLSSDNDEAGHITRRCAPLRVPDELRIRDSRSSGIRRTRPAEYLERT